MIPTTAQARECFSWPLRPEAMSLLHRSPGTHRPELGNLQLNMLSSFAAGQRTTRMTLGGTKRPEQGRWLSHRRDTQATYSLTQQVCINGTIGSFPNFLLLSRKKKAPFLIGISSHREQSPRPG